MYFWKCCRETRVSFYAFLLIAFTLAAFPWKVMDSAMSDLRPNQFFAVAWLVLLFGSSALLSLAGMSFGATGIGEEFPHKTAEFLLTKPRSIRWFVWTAWAANALQFLVLMGIMVLVGASILWWRYHVAITWRLLLTFVPGLILTFLVFGITYLLGVLHRNGRSGFLSSLGVVILFPIFCFAAAYFWHIHLPSPGDMYPVQMSEVVQHPELVATLPPLWPSVGWSLVALSCPLAAELVLKHTEL
jgi:ABC-type transport system involved in multi-copper enzyme maturation permease subunit